MACFLVFLVQWIGVCVMLCLGGESQRGGVIFDSGAILVEPNA